MREKRVGAFGCMGCMFGGLWVVKGIGLSLFLAFCGMGIHATYLQACSPVFIRNCVGGLALL